MPEPAGHTAIEDCGLGGQAWHPDGIPADEHQPLGRDSSQVPQLIAPARTVASLCTDQAWRSGTVPIEERSA
jgi:hypothetical protein